MGMIVVGVDESEGAAQALRWSVDEAQRRGSDIEAVMCWSYLEQHRLGDKLFDPGYGEPEARAALAEIVEHDIGPACAEHVKEEVVNDLPARGLLERARDAELLVLGARGMSTMREVLVGSVTRQCLHHSQVPITVVRRHDGERRTFGRIVVGIDGSPASKRALEWAVAEARTRQARLVVVHTWRLPIVGGTPALSPVIDYGAFERSAHELIDDALATIDTSGLPASIERVAVLGSAGDTLVSEAVDADLVVIGSRGTGGFRQLLLGSVSHDVAHHAPCPVVVIPHAGHE